MGKLTLYCRLAAQNIVKNIQFYLPYFLTCAAASAMFYIMFFISCSDMVAALPGSDVFIMIMHLGIIVIGIFSAVVVLYANSFIMKRRKREFGLYNILGMEKGQISLIICWEVLITAVIGIAAGLLLGILFSKLILMLLFRLLHFSVSLGFYVSLEGIIGTALLFFGIFAFTAVLNIIRVHRSSPIDLLHSQAVGEREPKSKLFLTLIGLAALSSGYYIAITTESPLSAVYLFFIAVMLVIIGTYCLFTSGSVVILKGLRKNRRFYYSPKHFTAVSGLIYRMKQNAVGLANICILATMVLVTISTTVSLYAGTEDAISLRYPSDIMVSRPIYDGEDLDTAALFSDVKEAVAQSGRTITAISDCRYLTVSASRDGSSFRFKRTGYSESDHVQLVFITAEEYGILTGQTPELSDGQVLCYSTSKASDGDITIEDMQFTVKERLESFPIHGVSAYIAYLTDVECLVLPDSSVLNKIYEAQLEAYGPNNASHICYDIGLDIDGTDEEKLACFEAVDEAAKIFCGADSDGNMHYIHCTESRQQESAYFYSLYGGFLFVGIFLGLVFTIATVLIIYYKQVSEGYEDRQRFEIMQKVGMSQREVKGSIKSQILLVFFLPLGVAAIHILAAFKLITRLLTLFNLTNITLFAVCTLVTLLIFALVYIVVYAITSRTYYKIVKM